MPRNRFDEIVDSTVQRMVELISAAPEADAPFDSKKLSRREQLLNYLPTRTDPVAARQIVDSEGIKGAVEYAENMERLMKGVLEDAGIR